MESEETNARAALAAQRDKDCEQEEWLASRENGTCWICGDRAENGQEGYSSTPMVLPGFTKPVWVCGMCIIRAMNSQTIAHWRAEARLAETVKTVTEAINEGRR